MIVELSNGRKFLVSLTYKNNFKETMSKDKYERTVYTTWEERDTLVFVSEWTKKMPDALAKFVGIAHCSYKDKFSRRKGKEIAYLKALRKVLEMNVINGNELTEMISFKLNSEYYNVKE